MTTHPYTPPFLSVLAHRLDGPGTTERDRIQAKLDYAVTKKYLRHFYGIEVTGGPRYKHVSHQLGSGCVKIGSLGKDGLRIYVPAPGEFVADVYYFRMPLYVEQRMAMFSWWHWHEGDAYGKVHWPRQMWWGFLGLILPIDYSRVVLTGTGMTCAVALDDACLAQGNGVDLWDKIPNRNRIVSPELLVRSPKLKVVYKGWSP
jgi:hypothetical protein